MKIRAIILTMLILVGFTVMAENAIMEPMTEEASFTELILGEGITLDMFLVYFVFGLIGLISSVAFDIYSSGTSGNKLSGKIWWNDNKWRLLLSVLTVIIAILFSEQLMSITMSNWAGFLAGFTADKLIESLIQRRRRKKETTTKK